MRLLFVTQTVDRKDPQLGIYVNWIRELAKRAERITVFALKTGEYQLPENVSVVPLRPWGHRARLRTAFRVLRLAWKHRRAYDAVFVHMNQEYLLVAGWLWRLLGKRVYMWRNHYEGSIFTDIAALFCDKIFYTSKSSYTAKYKKGRQMPVGVDVESCNLDEPIERRPGSVLFLGRFDISKRPDLLVEALGLLAKEGVEFSATFVGGPADPASTYPKQVEERAKALGIGNKTKFVGAVPNTETYKYYRSHAIYVNASKSGMFDKSLFKSIVCGCLPLFVSADMAELAGGTYAYKDADAADLARLLKEALAFPEEKRASEVARLNATVVEKHRLPVLADTLVREMQG